MPSFAYFELCDPSNVDCGGRQGAYMSGSNRAECDTGNGATSCLVGKFVDILATGTVGPGVGSGTGSKALGVQLIKQGLAAGRSLLSRQVPLPRCSRRTDRP